MTDRNRADEQDRATDAKFYLPAGVNQSFDASWFERIWAALFNHGV